MTVGKIVVNARKKMQRLVLGTFLLLALEFFILTPFIGGFAFGIMIVTFIAGMWLGNRIADPLLDLGEEAIMSGMAKESGEGKNH
jgi:hypothetical protein